MSASKSSGVASEKLTAQQDGTLPQASAEPLGHHGKSDVASSETQQTLGASQPSVTAPGGSPQAQAVCPGGQSQPDGVAARDGTTRGASASVDLTATQTAPPRRLGEHELLDKLGEGGMGAVYRARHTKLKRLEAVKILPNRRLEDAHAVARFEREMEAVGRLNHPHIVQAHDAREVDGMHILVMEYVEGVDLSHLVRGCGPLPVPDACELIRQAALGLQYAHEHGLVHRDIKPSNLMLSFGDQCSPPQCSPVSPKPDRAGPDAAADRAGHGVPRLHSEPVVKILDLGLALLTAGEPGTAEMTGSGQAMGTADYMAPEQVTDSHHVDIRADIYSLGCTLYKLLTGHAPFSGAQYAGGYQKMAAHLHEPCQPVRQSRPDIPEALEQVLARMMAKQPADRFATPGELAEALRLFTAGCDLRRLAAQAHARTAPGQPLTAATDARAETDPRRPSVGRSLRDRHPTTVAIAVALLLIPLLALGVVFYLRDGQQTVKVELDGTLAADTTVTVWLDGRQMEVQGLGETIRLKPGPHGYEIRRGDQIITTREFTVVKGDNPVLKISVEPTPTPAKAEPTTAGAGYELAFDGYTSYVATPVKYDGSHPLTLEAWVTIGGEPTWYHLVFSNRDKDGGSTFGVNAEMRWRFDLRRSDKEDYAEARSKATAPLERHHVALVFDAHQPSLFVDGLHVEIGPFSDTDKYRPSTQPFTIGACRVAGADCSHAFLGTVGEVRFSRTARYHADFTPQQRFDSDEHTIALYHFDEGSGNIARDASGNGNDATIVGAEWLDVGYKRPLPGIVGRPTPLAGLGRWQVATVRPNEDVISAAWSPDGSLIACGTIAGWVRLYDARTLALVRLLPAHKGQVNCVAWSPDGAWLATGGHDQGARLWSKDGRPGWTLGIGTSPLCVAWSPDGKRLAWGGFGPGVRLCSAYGKMEPVFQGHTGNILGVAWSPNGRQIASASADHTICLWTADGTAGPILKGHEGVVHSVAWSPDGAQLVSGDDHGEIRLWTAAGEPGRVLTGHTLPVASIVWSPDGTKILSGSSDSSVRIWSAVGPSDPIVVQTKTCAVNAVAWSPDGAQVVSGGQSGIVQLWRNDGTSERLLGGEFKSVRSIECCRATGQIALTASDTAVRVWRADRTPDRILRADNDVIQSIAWSPDGEQLASGDWSGNLRVWKPDGSLVRKLLGHQSQVYALAWHPDGQRLATAGLDRTVRLWQPDGTSVPVVEGSQVRSLAWHPDGTQLASGGDDGQLRFWQADGTPATKVDTTQVGIWSIAWAPDGKRLATGGVDVKLWQRDGTPGPVLRGHVNGVIAVAWSPDGQWLASGSYDTTVRLWRSDGTFVRTLSGHLGAVNSLAWADERRLISGDAGGVVRMWNAETGAAEWTAICLKDNRHVTFSPTGEILYGHPKVIEEDLIYLLEPPDGPIELLKPSEFKKRAGR